MKVISFVFCYACLFALFFRIQTCWGKRCLPMFILSLNLTRSMVQLYSKYSLKSSSTRSQILNPMTQSTGFASVPSSQLLQTLKMIESLSFFCHAWCWIRYCLCHSNFMSDQIPVARSSLTLSLHELHIQCSGWFDRCLTVGPFGSSGCVCTHWSALMKLWHYGGVPTASHFLRSLKRIRYPA